MFDDSINNLERLKREIDIKHKNAIIEYFVRKFGKDGKIEIPIEELERLKEGGNSIRGDKDTVTIYAFDTDKAQEDFINNEKKNEEDDEPSEETLRAFKNIKKMIRKLVE